MLLLVEIEFWDVVANDLAVFAGGAVEDHKDFAFIWMVWCKV